MAYWLGGAASPERSSSAINRYSTCIETMGFGRWALDPDHPLRRHVMYVAER